MLNTYNIKIQYNAWTIPLLRTHNIYIMEAISKMGLTIIQLKQSNACRMYLQITMTQAEILDHMGCFLLTQALLQQTQTKPLGLESLSTLTLEWPAVNNPTKATWKLWTMTICTLFTGNAQGTKLQTPLGPWTTNYQTYHNWKWHMTPDQRLLQQRLQLQAWEQPSLLKPINVTWCSPYLSPPTRTSMECLSHHTIPITKMFKHHSWFHLQRQPLWTQWQPIPWLSNSGHNCNLGNDCYTDQSDDT